MVDEAPKPNMNGKEHTMDNGVGVSDVGILAGLYGGISGRGGYGGGAYGGGGGYGSGYGGGHGSMYGDHSAIRADVKANRDIDIIGAISKNSTDGFISAQVAGNKDFISSKIDGESFNRQFSDLQNQINQSNNSLSAEMSRQALAAAECCCENRVGQAEIKGELRALGVQNDRILDNQVQARNDVQHTELRNQNGSIEAQVAALTAIVMSNNNNGGHH